MWLVETRAHQHGPSTRVVETGLYTEEPNVVRAGVLCGHFLVLCVCIACQTSMKNHRDISRKKSLKQRRDWLRGNARKICKLVA